MFHQVPSFSQTNTMAIWELTQFSDAACVFADGGLNLNFAISIFTADAGRSGPYHAAPTGTSSLFNHWCSAWLGTGRAPAGECYTVSKTEHAVLQG